MATRRKRVEQFDWWLFALLIGVIGIGCLLQYAVAGPDISYSKLSQFLESSFGRHTMFSLAGIVIIGFSQLIPWRTWYVSSYLIYALAIIGLIAVLIFGVEIKGAKSWFQIFGLGIQPAEFAKFGTLVSLSSLLSAENFRFRNRADYLKSIGLILPPVVLILLQPDAGSALVFVSFLVLLYFNGFSAQILVTLLLLLATVISALSLEENWVIFILQAIAISVILNLFQFQNQAVAISFGLIVIFLAIWYFIPQYAAYINLGYILTLSVLAYLSNRKSNAYFVGLLYLIFYLVAVGSSFFYNNVLKDHQRDRIDVWLNPEKCDPQGSLYNLIQSKLTIGAGGWAGRGLHKGYMTNLNYVPEQNTDFIITVLAEEFGFQGILIFLLIYGAMLFRILRLSETHNMPFVRNFGIGLSAILFFHLITNVGMTVGLMPIIGIPLPLISLGGSSMLVFCLMIGIFLNMNTQRI